MIGIEENKKKCTNEKVNEWKKEINMLTDIATTHPEAAYTAYATNYRHKLTYLLQTIPNIEDLLKKIIEIVQHKLIPVIGGHIMKDAERESNAFINNTSRRFRVEHFRRNGRKRI